MGYWNLNKSQCEVLRETIRGRTVHDLGAGDLSLSRELLRLGARDVVAIERSRDALEGASWMASLRTRKRTGPGKISVRNEDFRGFDQTGKTVEIAVISWPWTHCENLVRILRRAEQIIYLGKSTDGIMCQGFGIFEHMAERAVSWQVQDRKNSLIVYGSTCGLGARRLYGEEIAALHRTRHYTYEESLEMEDGMWEYQRTHLENYKGELLPLVPDHMQMFVSVFGLDNQFWNG